MMAYPAAQKLETMEFLWKDVKSLTWLEYRLHRRVVKGKLKVTFKKAFMLSKAGSIGSLGHLGAWARVCDTYDTDPNSGGFVQVIS